MNSVSNHPEVVRTRKERDAALAGIPAKPANQFTLKQRAAFSRLQIANEAHAVAVRNARREAGML